MKQPELGQKIAALRKVKGFTQEELCQACSINVRSLQRIENGEVNPRVYTLKLISEQLGHDFWSQVAMDQSSKKESWWNHNLVNPPSDQTMAVHAKWGWIGGILYFLMTIPDVILGSLRYSDSLSPSMEFAYILNSLAVILSAILFFRGFSTLGRKLGQSIVTISANLIILLTVMLYGYDLLSLRFEGISTEILPFMHLITLGFAGIFFGIGLSRIEPKIGTAAKIAAILEIVTGISFIFIITALVGFITVFPAIIVEIIIMHKVHGMYSESSKKLSWAG